MEPKNSKIFKKEIIQAVSAYCESEKIEDIDHFMYLCFKQGFDIKKYGLLGDNSEKIGGEQKKWVEKEVIVEKRVEVPVEVIKEVEKIVEVPVEAIKEVEKIVEVIKEVEKPNDNMSMLQETLLSLRKELHTKNERIKELEKINRDLENISSQKGAVFLRGSNLNNRI